MFSISYLTLHAERFTGVGPKVIATIFRCNAQETKCSVLQYLHLFTPEEELV